MHKKTLFLIQILSLALLALSILGMAFTEAPFDGQAKPGLTGILFYVDGILFWASLMALIVISIIINHGRRADKGFMRKFPKGRLGLTAFGRNKKARIADGAMLASWAGFFILVVWKPAWLTAQFVFLAAAAFSLGMHCILNGINYCYIQFEGGKGHE